MAIDGPGRDDGASLAVLAQTRIRISTPPPLTPPVPPEDGPAPRKRPRQDRSQITVEAVLEAAAQVLVADGYDAMTVSAVADRAGVSVGSLYQYFADKASLVAGVVEAHLARETEVIGAALLDAAGLPIAAAVERTVRAFVDVNAEDPARSAAYLVAARDVAWAEGIEEVAAQSVEAVAAFLAARADELRVPDPALAAFVLVCAIAGLVERAVTLRPEAAASGALADEASALARRYLLPD